MKNNYQKKCPKCDTELYVDDIDYNFKGNQDEYLICPKCYAFVFAKVRYNKVCKIEFEEMDADTKEMYRNGYGGVIK